MGQAGQERLLRMLHILLGALATLLPQRRMFMSIGSVFGIGGTSVISRALGEGRQEYAKKVCSFCERVFLPDCVS